MIDDTIKTAQEIENQIAETSAKTEPEVTDVDLGFVEKKRFRICGDYNRMLELNVSDLNIASRLKIGYPKLKNLLLEAQKKVESISDDLEDEAMLGELADKLTEIDKEMRDVIDYIFDTNASAICAPSGNMYDPVNGQFRFERIIEKLSALYSNGLDEEFKKIKNRVEGKTSKYTKKGKK